MIQNGNTCEQGEDQEKYTMSSNDFKDQTQHRTAEETSERKGEDSAPAGPGQTTTSSGTPENPAGHINPSAPEDSNATPGSTGQK